MLRVGKQRAHVGDFDQLTAVHNGNSVCEVGDNTHVVGDEHNSGGEFIFQRPHEVEDLRLDRDVECCCRFVRNHKVGSERQCHGDDDALFLSARELVRVVVEALIGLRDADFLHGFDSARPKVLFACLGVVRAQAFRDLPADGEHGVERGGRLLEHHRGFAAAHGGQLSGRHLQDVVT